MQSKRTSESSPKNSSLNIYFAFEGFENELAQELTHIQYQHERLFITDSPPEKPVWAQFYAYDCQYIEFDSINDAIKKLKSVEYIDKDGQIKKQKRWCNYSWINHRRSELIQKNLFEYKEKKWNFLDELPHHCWGFWSLINNTRLICSPKINTYLPLGEIEFNEDKETPPSRAYLKLWELFTIHKIKPSKGETVMDMGSCPGGWTWVLQQIGCDVISVDKARIDEKISNLPRVKFLKKDAFSLKTSEVKQIDWFFSDIICYPPKLLELVSYWEKEGHIKNFVCTIKFQGKTDYETLDKFRNYKDAKIIHLCNNKHEVTWIFQKENNR